MNEVCCIFQSLLSAVVIEVCVSYRDIQQCCECGLLFITGVIQCCREYSLLYSIVVIQCCCECRPLYISGFIQCN